MSHYCPSCGTPLNQDAHFCPECGHRLDVPQQGYPADQPTQVLSAPMAGPPPSGAPPADTGNRNLMIVMGILVGVVIVAMGVFAFLMLRPPNATTASDNSTTSPSPTPTPTVTKTEKPKPNPTVTVTRTAIPDLGNRGGFTVPGGFKTCDVGVYANSVTSCGFANNVASAWYASGAAAYLPSVYSPATGQYYDMYCTDTLPASCTGGNNAEVVIDYLPGD